MRLLVFGKGGQVSKALMAVTQAEGIAARFLGQDEADLTDPETCARRIAEADVTAVINAAAYTAVDAAETDREVAHLVNAAAPGAMARAAAAKGVPFVHISTDYVFDGAGTRAWTEDDPTGPLGYYGQSKLDGEREVLAAGGQGVILRTAWVYDGEAKNFVTAMLGLAAGRDVLKVVDDQRGSPTPARAVAEACLAVARAFEEGRGTAGLFHFAGQPPVARNAFAEAILAATPNPPRIEPVSSDAFPTPAERPANSVLDCTRIGAVYGIAQPDWRPDVAAIAAAYSPKTAPEDKA
ncbi:MAG: dTDP-4-dehydrorhamnose reductase [Rhodobacterales bacterium]|nr:MAG: dTDP-4-dehydrorhamnose reductase [Rhodobacterales bacterium]